LDNGFQRQLRRKDQQMAAALKLKEKVGKLPVRVMSHMLSMMETASVGKQPQ
jgi:hypothetical protein